MSESNIQEWWYRDVFILPDYSKTWGATDWFAGYVIRYPTEFEIDASSSDFAALEKENFSSYKRSSYFWNDEFR
ncbi:MAG: hypothetical protein HY863_14060 [Chloroflexi bacterium]|nr:hypothetical protein [Chloroflexota bacterium]